MFRFLYEFNILLDGNTVPLGPLRYTLTHKNADVSKILPAVSVVIAFFGEKHKNIGFFLYTT